MSYIRSDKEIYEVLERHLRAAVEPLTAPALLELPDVKALVGDPKKLSDHLGHMWRRGLLERYPAPQHGPSMARWAYKWKEQETGAAGAQRVTLEVGGLKITIIVEPK